MQDSLALSMLLALISQFVGKKTNVVLGVCTSLLLTALQPYIIVWLKDVTIASTEHANHFAWIITTCMLSR